MSSSTTKVTTLTASLPPATPGRLSVADRGQVRASHVLESRRDRHPVYVNPDFAAIALDFLRNKSE